MGKDRPLLLPRPQAAAAAVVLPATQVVLLLSAWDAMQAAVGADTAWWHPEHPGQASFWHLQANPACSSRRCCCCRILQCSSASWQTTAAKHTTGQMCSCCCFCSCRRAPPCLHSGFVWHVHNGLQTSGSSRDCNGSAVTRSNQLWSSARMVGAAIRNYCNNTLLITKLD